MQRLRVGGVDVIIDAAHDPQGWSELATLLPPSYAAVVSISRDRSAQALALALRDASHVFVTQAWEGRSYDAAELGSILADSGSTSRRSPSLPPRSTRRFASRKPNVGRSSSSDRRICYRTH